MQKPNHKSNLKALCKMQISMDVHNHIYMKGPVSLQNSLTICKMLIPMFLSNCVGFFTNLLRGKILEAFNIKMWPLWKKALSNVIYGVK